MPVLFTLLDNGKLWIVVYVGCMSSTRVSGSSEMFIEVFQLESKFLRS